MLEAEDRIRFYREAFPAYPCAMVAVGGKLYGDWDMGNSYGGSGFYGSYPGNFMKRIRSMFPEYTEPEMLHLFSGSMPRGLWSRFDGNPAIEAEYHGQAEALSTFVPLLWRFKIIFADPPYTEEDANKYGTCMCNRNKVLEECRKVIPIGGQIVWLDQVYPMFSNEKLRRWGKISITISTNHRHRVATMFERVA